MKKFRGEKKWRRALSMLLVLTLVFSLCSVTAFATEEGNTTNSSEETLTGTTPKETTEPTETTVNVTTTKEEDKNGGQSENTDADGEDKQEGQSSGGNSSSNNEGKDDENPNVNPDDKSTPTGDEADDDVSNDDTDTTIDGKTNGEPLAVVEDEEDDEDEEEDKFGESATWSFEELNSTLTINFVDGDGVLPTIESGDTAPWYEYASKVKTLKIEEGITYLGCRDFFYLTEVETIYLPNSLTGINAYAFGGNDESIRINNATVYAACNFSDKLYGNNYGANNLTWEKNSHIAGSEDRGVTKCSNKNCGMILATKDGKVEINSNEVKGVTWSYEDGVLTLKADSNSGNVNLPESKNGTDTPWYSFAGDVKELVIGEGITGLGCRDFFYLTNVTKIQLPNSLTSINASAFGGVNTNIAIQKASVKAGCNFSESLYDKNYGAIELSWSMDSHTDGKADDKGVTRCKNTNCGMIVKADNQAITIDGGNVENATWSYDHGTLTISASEATSDVVLPTSEKGIQTPWYEFARDVKTLIIEEGIKELGLRDFFYLTNVTSIQLPNSLTAISANAFGGVNSNTCIKSAEVSVGCNFSDKLYKSDNYGATGLTWKDKAEHTFDYNEGYCTNTNCKEPCNISGNIIINDKKLEGATWTYKDNVLTIKGSGTLPESKNGTDTPWYGFASSITKLVVEEGITGLGGRDFFYLTKVETIELPNSLTSISPYAFGGDNTSIAIQNAKVVAGCNFSESLYGKSYGAKNISEDNWSMKPHTDGEGSSGVTRCANDNCNMIVKASGDVIIDTTTVSGATWLYDHGTLTISASSTNADIVLPTSEKGIQTPWYEFARDVKTLIIEEGIKELGLRDFFYLTNVTSIQLPNSVTAISANAFGGTNDNTRINKATVTVGCYFSDKLFANGNYGANELKWYDDDDNKNKAAHNFDYENTGLCTNTNCYEPFKQEGDLVNEGKLTNGKWSYLDNVLTISGEGILPEVASGGKAPWYSFAKSVNTLIIEEGVTRLSMRDFFYITNVKEIYLPKSLTKIDNYVFGGTTDSADIILKKATVYYYDGTVAVGDYGGESLVWKPYVATVDGTDYASLEKAAKATEENGTITLIHDASVDTDETVNLNKDITLDMSSYTITVNGTLNISAGTYNNSDDNGFIVGEGGKLVISGGTFTSEIKDNLANGYYAFADDDVAGTYTVSKGGKLKFNSNKTNVEFAVKLNSNDATAIGDDSGSYYLAKAGDIVAVTVTVPEGKQFDGWYDGDSKLSTKTTFQFKANRDVTYTAEFSDKTEDTTATEEPTIYWSDYSQTTVNGKAALLFQVTRSVPTGYKVTETGVIYATNSAMGIKGIASTSLLTAGDYGEEWVKNKMTASGWKYVSKTSETSMSRDGVYTYKMTVGSKTAQVYAIGYVKVKKGDNEETLYTDVIAVTYNNGPFK